MTGHEAGEPAMVIKGAPIRFAVASRDGETVSGHIGKCADWIVFTADFASRGGIKVTETGRVTLPKNLVFHHYKDEGLRPLSHPLADCHVVVGASAGDSFITKMQARGFEVALTAESDPATVVANYLGHKLAPPKPRPIGSLICKIHDALSP